MRSKKKKTTKSLPVKSSKANISKVACKSSNTKFLILERSGGSFYAYVEHGLDWHEICQLSRKKEGLVKINPSAIYDECCLNLSMKENQYVVIPIGDYDSSKLPESESLINLLAQKLLEDAEFSDSMEKIIQTSVRNFNMKKLGKKIENLEKKLDNAKYAKYDNWEYPF